MRINPITVFGIALIVLGIVAFTYQGITYTSREKVIDNGAESAQQLGPHERSNSPQN